MQRQTAFFLFRSKRCPFHLACQEAIIHDALFLVGDAPLYVSLTSICLIISFHSLTAYFRKQNALVARFSCVSLQKRRKTPQYLNLSQLCTKLKV